MLYRAWVTLDFMRAFMPGPNRINICGLMCSCVAQGAILGGLFFSGWSTPARVLDRRVSSRPMVVELIPLDAEGESQNAMAAPSPVARQLPAVGAGTARARPVAVAEPVKLVEVATIKRIAVPSLAEAGGAAAAGSGAELTDYQRRLYEIVARNSRYPGEAKRLRLAGVTHLAFRLDRLGNVLDSWVQKSSGSDVLDEAALEALKRSQPLPPIPPGLPSRMEFVIEIDSSTVQQFALSSGR